MLRVDERSLVSEKSPPRPVRRRSSGGGAARPEGPTEKTAPALKLLSRPEAALEAHCLRLLLRQPDALYLLDRVLQKAGVSRFSVQDFEHADYQALAGVILQSIDQDDLEANQYIQEKLPEDLHDVVLELLAPFPQGEPSAERLIEDLIQTVMRLRQVRTRAHVDQLIFMQQDVQQVESSFNPEDFQGIHQVVLQCTRVLKNLNRALGQPIQLD